MKPLITLTILLLLYGCNSPNKCKLTEKAIGDSASTRVTYSNIIKNRSQISAIDNWEFEKKIYLKIDKIYTGKVYTNKNGVDAFYRILFIPEEENKMIEVENISIGEEGGNYKLVKRFTLTNDIDSLIFVDSANIKTYTGNKKSLINLDKIK